MKRAVKTINAEPTKELFIDMLIRDISLIDSISDLIDNCVDGAIRLNPSGDFSGLHVDISVSEDEFIISDNCGGIPVEMAEQYAFRFGRISETPPTEFSLGLFGIGMKRALLKMGQKFSIVSTTKTSRFVVDIDVEAWKTQKEWNFNFKELDESLADVPDEKTGTRITVRSIYPDVKKRYRQEVFISQLIAEIEKEHLLNISKGLTVFINGKALKAELLQLQISEVIKPVHIKKTFHKPSEMTVDIFAGISEPKLQQGGWYIFCNDRLIIGPEQTETTGWGCSTPIRIPKYHIQFSRFRGYVFFKAKDATQLPWNTSKNNVDIDSPKYQATKYEMMKIKRPIIDFLNKLHDEKNAYDNGRIEEKKFHQIVDNAKERQFHKIEKYAKKFKYPAPSKPRKKLGEVKISYTKPETEVKKLQDFFSVKSRKQVGEKSFDYVFRREVE